MLVPPDTPLTVGMLIGLLQQFPETLPVAYVYHSELDVMTAGMVRQEELFDNGGYSSRPYREQDKPLVRTYIVFPGA